MWVAKSRRRRRKRGKRAGVLIRLRRHAFRPPLPTILLANVQSLDNKLCELRARISYQREIRDCCVICLTETWMSAMVPDSAIELTGFSVHRSDRTKELTGKSRGGGVCFYINNLWCDERNIHSIKSFCSPDLEFHMLLCRPFWLPREFTAIIITAVYIPPQANTDQALRELYRNIMALFHCMVRHGTVHFWGVFHWVLYLVPDTFLVPLRSRFHRAVPLPKCDV